MRPAAIQSLLRPLLIALVTIGGLTASSALAGKTDVPPASVTAPPDYSGSSQSVHVPFAKAVDFDKLATLHVRVKINDGPVISLLVDTGSVGVIVGADEVPKIDPNAESGSITYSSSGVEIDGVWTPTTIEFVDAVSEDGKPVTAHVPVLAAQRSTVHPGAVNGSKNPEPPRESSGKPKAPHPYMCGIGFGRGQTPHPERNPFINLAAMQAGTMRRGYTITRDGFDFGLTPANTGTDSGKGDSKNAKYLFDKLTERPVPGEKASEKTAIKDWATPSGGVTIANQPRAAVNVLLDTGLTNMMVELPAFRSDTDVPNGTPITIDLMGGRLKYSFKVGDPENPFAPRRVTAMHRDVTFVNTGLRALAGFDFLYDADGGYLGLRPTR